MGNVGTLLSFEVGAEDAEILSKEFSPMETEDFISLEKFNFYIKLMIEGKTSSAFSGVGLLPEKATASSASQKAALSLSRLTYGVPRELIERQIKDRLQ